MKRVSLTRAEFDKFYKDWRTHLWKDWVHGEKVGFWYKADGPENIWPEDPYYYESYYDPAWRRDE